MATQTVRVAAARIAEHAAAHGLERVHVVLHGGEPLLLGHTALRSVLVELRSAIEPVAELDLRLQSNGVLLSAALCELFVEHGVKVGISLDGDGEANDRHRRFASGAGSHEQVLRALALLRRAEYRRSYAGILCTIDIDNDPVRVYEALVAQEPPRIDLLLPHATWDRPPRRPDEDPTPYATWLRRVYERWVADARPVPIRLFDSLLATAAGGRSASESVGLEPADLVVIETDGAWEQADSMKTAFDGAPATGMTIFTHAAADVAALPEIARRQTGLADLCSTCRACPVVRQCGGGLFAHRFRTGSGFDNPSVYCADLTELIASINGLATRRAVVVGATTPTVDQDGAPGADPVPPDVLRLIDDVGAGYGTAATMGFLADTQLSIVRALVAAVADAATSGSGPAGSGLAAAGWDLLTRLDRTAPQAVRSVLSHPYVRAWAVGCLGRPGARPGWENLACLAGAAAIRAGAQAQVVVPVRSGMFHLPTLGTVRLPGTAAVPSTAVLSTAALSTSSEGFTVRAGDTEVTVLLDDVARPQTGWRPTPRVVTGGLVVTIEDTDPYRECYPWPCAAPLSGAAARGWRARLVKAWQGIARDVPGQVPAMGQALRAVTPLPARPAGRMRSATARHAFGAVGIELTEAEAFAVMLVHEFQHTKLGAVMDLCDLADPDYRGRLRVGWRDDPRPVEGVLQGTYAHVGVADVWRARGDGSGPLRSVAVERFRQYRRWTVDALDALAATGALTPAGVRFVDRMGQTVENWSV